MLSTFMTQIGTFFDKRFLLSAWFPTYLFGAAAVVVAALARGVPEAVEAWDALPALTQAWLAAGSLVLVTLVAYLCDNLLGLMVRLYEGYWPQWWGGLRRLFVGLQRRRWQHLNGRLDLVVAQQWNLELAMTQAAQKTPPGSAPKADADAAQKRAEQFRADVARVAKLKPARRVGELVRLCQQLVPAAGDEAGDAQALLASFLEQCQAQEARLQAEHDRLYAALYRAYPQSPARLMPTRLGNVLRSAEEYGRLTYNLDAATVWPRLVPQLPAAFQTRLEQASTPLTTMLFCATLSFSFAVVGGGALAATGSPWPLFVLTVVAGLVLGSWCYESAVQRAVEYGALIRTAFDLYRADLLKALGVPLPASPLEEWKLWPQLMVWWYQHQPPFDAQADQAAWNYERRAPKKEPQ